MEQSLPEGGAASDVDQTVFQLLRIGFLQSVLPWHSNEVHLERTMLGYLRALPQCTELDVAIAGLERIVALEVGSPRPRLRTSW